MVYSNRFVACVLVGDTPQQELANGTVRIPFGTEYAIRLRNKNNRRAVAKIFIDGENVSEGGYIIAAHGHTDIRRHASKDCAFKFVDLDSPEAVDAGKNGPNDNKEKGLIVVHFHLEKERPAYTPVHREVHHHHHHDHYVDRWPGPFGGGTYGPLWLSDTTPVGSTTQHLNSCNAPEASNSPDALGTVRSFCRSRITKSVPVEQKTRTCSAVASAGGSSARDGCTVEGGTTGQNFWTQWVDAEESYTVVRLFLQGYDAYEETAAVATSRPANKESRLNALEAENERLRQQLAEAENAKLKEKIEQTKKASKRPRKKKKATPPEA